MKKETFIEAIEAIRKQYDYDAKFAEGLGKLFPNSYDANLIYDNSSLQNTLLKVLQEQMNDKFIEEIGMSDIEYFCFEMDFGRNKLKCSAYSNVEELYNFLKNR